MKCMLCEEVGYKSLNPFADYISPPSVIYFHFLASVPHGSDAIPNEIVFTFIFMDISYITIGGFTKSELQ